VTEVRDCPEKTEDGRSYFVILGEGEKSIWAPDPPRHDDRVYCRGVDVGHFHGEYVSVPESGDQLGYCGWCLVTKPLRELPASIAERLRATQ
jgi:hypothetical protein